MPTQIITTSYSVDEFRELLKSLLSEIIKEELSKLISASQKPLNGKEFLTRQETAEILGISLPTLHNRIKDGFIVPRRVGNRVRFKWEDIQKAMRTYEEKKMERKR